MKEYTVRAIEIFKVCAENLVEARQLCEKELQGNHAESRDLIVIGEADVPGEKNVEFHEDYRTQGVKGLVNRIGELRNEILRRDRAIEELEKEILIKDEIIRKQVVMMGEKLQ